MDVVIPWNRPGYLQGSHPLMLGYLNQSGETTLLNKQPGEYVFDNAEQKLQILKRRTAQVLQQILAAAPNVPFNGALDYLSNRGTNDLSELFLDDPDRLVFDHTTLHPLESRFILHFENPSTLFYPFVWYYPPGGRNFRLYQHAFFYAVRAVLESDACRMIFCHLNLYTENLRRIFQSAKISQKARLIRPHIRLLNNAPPRRMCRMMFSNSFGASDERFFLRGGMAALAAFLRVSKDFPDAELVVLSALPTSLPSALLAEAKANPKVIIVRQGISEDEMSALCADVDILLNVSTGLHTMNILRAMSAGSVVVASDVAGNEEYIRDGQNGIILRGVAERVNFTDPESGLMCDDYSQAMAINQDMVEPLVDVLVALMSEPSQYHSMRENAISYVRQNFNSGAPNCNLWDVVREIGD